MEISKRLGSNSEYTTGHFWTKAHLGDLLKYVSKTILAGRSGGSRTS
jgi:hypothetical protein